MAAGGGFSPPLPLPAALDASAQRSMKAWIHWMEARCPENGVGIARTRHDFDRSLPVVQAGSPYEEKRPKRDNGFAK